MMQKMGWAPGKGIRFFVQSEFLLTRLGLGVKEDGRLKNVSLEFKDDNLGIQ
jgi:hypothetical protein